MKPNFKALRDARPEYKWRVGVAKNNTITCLAYVDARIVQELFDEHIGAENWKCSYSILDGRMFCGISIKIGDEWVTKSDTGTESREEAQKGEVSDSFKRAAIAWGCCRFLYFLDSITILNKDNIGSFKNSKGYDSFYLKDNGKKVYDVTKFCNDLKRGGKVMSVKTLHKLVMSDASKEKILQALSKYYIDTETRDLINMLKPDLL